MISGLTRYISAYCTTNKAAMLDSVKNLKYTTGKRDLLNTINGGHQVIGITGTLYWGYATETGTVPAGGTLLHTIMTNDPSSTPDHAERWEFLGFGPWRDILQFPIAKGSCQSVQLWPP